MSTLNLKPFFSWDALEKIERGSCEWLADSRQLLRSEFQDDGLLLRAPFKKSSGFSLEES